MPWTTTRDLTEFLAAAGAFVRSRPVRHNVLLAVIERMRRTAGDPPLLGWWADDAGTAGAFSHTDGLPLAVTAMPDQALDELVNVLVPPLAGIGAEVGAAERFARRWSDRTGVSTSVHRRQRMYRLGELAPPPATPGRARTAVAADRDLLHAWHEAFLRELDSTSVPDVQGQVAARLGYGGLVLWEVDGVPVSMAGRTRPLGDICRIPVVYTPPEHRGHGYGAAVTAAVSRDAVATGVPLVLLFTDADNPTPNGVYQRIGYRPVQDRIVIAFS
ncbi:MAG TPA: GNAT family N-acetyltransferase [Pseudonocardiaceae bacterium]|nr:GNAT family N-acetyltransferase [Pseudonocardiaceae bacterium]